MICLSLDGPAAGAGSFPQGSGGLVGRRVLAPRGHSCWPVLSLLPPSYSPQACSSPSPLLPLPGPLSSRDHSRVTLPARGKGGSFTSPSSQFTPPFAHVPQDVSSEATMFPEKMSNGMLRGSRDQEAMAVPEESPAQPGISPTFILQETSL